VLVPIIVRPIGKDRYEILAGHNRVEVLKQLERTSVPAIIRDDLTDNKALLVMVETNLHQRSLADLPHSQRAFTLGIHHDAIKSQGRRDDLVREVEEMLSGRREPVSVYEQKEKCW